MQVFPEKAGKPSAVLTVFVHAYNRFGFQKDCYCFRHPGVTVPFSPFDFL